MGHSNEKAPRKGSRPSVALLVIAVAGTAMLSIGAITTTTAYAQALGNDGHGTPREDPGQPDDPDCWGEVSSDLAQTVDESPGLGEHASDPIPGDADNETPRRGIGNNFQGDDTPPEHGATVAPIDGNPETDCEADQNN
jgi:hypothetical protein